MLCNKNLQCPIWFCVADSAEGSRYKAVVG